MQKLPQLTLRDLFWLVALVAMGCGWWVERTQIMRAADEEFNSWRNEAFLYQVKARWVADWLESRGFGTVEGIQEATTNVIITDADGMSRTYRTDQ